MSSAKDLLETLQKFDPQSLDGDEPERIRVREKLTEVLRQVQSPWDVSWEHNWVSMATVSAGKTLVDAGVFEKWNEAGWKPQTTDELAALTGASADLLRRLLRHVAANHLLREVGRDTYAATPWAKAFVSYPFLAGTYGGFNHAQTEVNNKLPAYLASIRYQHPSDPKDCNFQFTHGAGSGPWQLLSTNPQLGADFNQAMESHSRFNLHSWTSLYPTQSIVQAAKERGTGGVLVVDVGGNKGYDLEKFRLVHSEDCTSESLVLEELPEVLKDAPELHSAIKPVAYDFFTEQSVKGARAYLMHNVIHDWDDDTAVKILTNVTAGFEKGYSRLLLHESIVDEVKPKAKVTASDMSMLCWFASKERTETEWNTLLTRAGLRLLKIWRPELIDTAECIIEAELA
ncbi:hypothetical protein PFICI_12587 [Pestalotiopsis fici W106-1]|uniref:Uncharacterized protein n=1 Tax=Pestalotiopsis fici (strain W106-1 / CGMCC3.15140) TaxID=1229662 RepID=W3WP55_PESFW|nr:uncharacterized protein PFICI_12587 [Pestalotiopsis fici W106-1]ETS75643.1 hypothetical protein PFICI_12587 [Pestalotiopsis fici W106-1]